MSCRSERKTASVQQQGGDGARCRPVGFFDSGIGGTCILNAFRRLCPDEETVYIADSKNCPYGNKPAEEIIRLSEANVKKLLRKNCKLIVVACNTATAAAIDYLRTKYPQVPFVGLEPAIKPAALRSKTGVVGVLATAGTFHGRLYNETKAKFAKNVTVLAVQADEFVIEVEKAYQGLGVLEVLEKLEDLEHLARDTPSQPPSRTRRPEPPRPSRSLRTSPSSRCRAARGRCPPSPRRRRRPSSSAAPRA